MILVLLIIVAAYLLGGLTLPLIMGALARVNKRLRRRQRPGRPD